MARVVDGRFELQELAGHGAMGGVFRARDTLRDRDVAVKLLLAENDEHRWRFEREAEALARLCHPHVVEYVAHGYYDGRPYLAMEWLEGCDLQQRLAAGPCSVEETIVIGAAIASAIAHAHEAGILHRDLKPANVFLPARRAAACKLLDFGIARLGHRASATAAGVVLGTPAYMSPEQARGEPLDARSDLFALGALLYEMLTGAPPFVGAEALAVLGKLLFTDPLPLQRALPAAPSWLAELCHRLLAKPRERRPPSARLVADALLTRESLALPVVETARLTDAERRRVFVVVATPAAPCDYDDTLPAAPAPEIEFVSELRLERLLDGTRLGWLVATGSATDAATHLARAALTLLGTGTAEAIGIATGLALVEPETAASEVIDRAVALCRAANSAGVYLDGASAALVESRFVLEGARLVSARVDADETRTLLGRPTPFVGRERELAMIELLIDQAIDERTPRALLVTAPPGTGKSRLRRELERRLATREPPPRVLPAYGEPIGAAAPFGLALQLLRQAASLRDDEPREQRLHKLTARLERTVAATDRPRLVAVLGELLGLQPPQELYPPIQAARRDARIMADELRRAWLDWLAAEGATGPLLLLLDDLQWSDQPSLELLDVALRELTVPLFVIGLARPELHSRFPSLWRERGLQEIALPSLPERAAERLIQSVLPDVAPAEMRRIVELARGNAFFLEELIRAAAEGAASALPESVLAMMQARLATLSPEARRLLRAASVFGDVFWEGAIFALLPERGADDPGELDRLVERELIERRRGGRYAHDSELRFRHALVREAVYGTLTDDDRRLGHELAARWLATQGEPDPLLIAEHYQRAGDSRSAGRWFCSAAEQACDAGAFAAARAHVQAAEACGLADDDRLRAARVDLDAAKWLGLGEPLQRSALALYEAEPPGSDDWYRAAAELSVLSVRVDEMTPQLVALGVPDEPSAVRFIQTARILTQLCRLNRVHEITAVLARLDAVAPRLQATDPIVGAWLDQAKAFAAAASDDLCEAVARFSASRAGFEACGDLRNALAQRLDGAIAWGEIGERDRARLEMAAIGAEARRHGLPRLEASARAYESHLALEAGDREAAQAAADHATRSVTGGLGAMYGALCQSMIAEERGDLETAERWARPIADDPHEMGRYWLAYLCVRRGRPEDALRILGEERPHHEALSFALLYALHYLVRALALRDLGQRDEARRVAAGARLEIRRREAAIRDPALRPSYLRSRLLQRILALADELDAAVS